MAEALIYEEVELVLLKVCRCFVGVGSCRD